MKPFTLLIKPSGSDCNLDCSYCFYKNRAPKIGQGKQRMSDEVLEKLVKDYLQLAFPVVNFTWQGGEPTLMGLDFYKRVAELQKQYAEPNQAIGNSLQTNGILLDDKWCQFLHDNEFLVGISIDGPKKFHDYYRKDHSGSGSFDKVMAAIRTCKEFKVEFNALVLLNDKNIDHPDELFDFFVENDIRYLQFICCAELDPATDKIADFSITAKQYGDFLCRIFDRWLALGPQNLSIRHFESMLSYCVTGRHTLCTFNKRCDDYIVVEYNGDVFPCDFFVEPNLRLGNITKTNIGKLAGSDKKRFFARDKLNLSNKCLVCRYLDVCRGGCTKDKGPAVKQEVNENYFCQGYKRFFEYSMPKFMQLAANIRAQ